MSLRSDLPAALDPAEVFAQAFGLEPLDWQRHYLRETRPTSSSSRVARSAPPWPLPPSPSTSALYWRDTNVVIVSPTLKQTGEILGKARLGLRDLGVRLVQDSASMLRLPNGSRIISLPGTARSVRGWTARLLILDEAAYHRARDVDRRPRPRRHGRAARRAEHAGARGGRLPRALHRGRRGLAAVHRPERRGADHRRGLPRGRAAGDERRTPTRPSTSARSARPAPPCSRPSGSPA